MLDHPLLTDPARRIAGQQRLLAWYARHRRDLPWRRQRTPYTTLVAEVMLQQTGVERVRLKYADFLAAFPSFEALARAPLGAVLRAWAGLGYNRRALYLHRLARLVVERYGGQLPGDPAQLRALPGIGPYTAGAILSFVFGADEPALDTNVRRVLSRLVWGGSRPPDRDLVAVARTLVPPGRSADWNEALMDLGALVCTLRAPGCAGCPLAPDCQAAFRPVTGRRLREAPAPFYGSRRYYRGQILAALRALSPGQTLGLDDLIARLAPAGHPRPADLERLVADLAAEGLVRVTASADGSARVGLPDA